MNQAIALHRQAKQRTETGHQKRSYSACCINDRALLINTLCYLYFRISLIGSFYLCTQCKLLIGCRSQICIIWSQVEVSSLNMYKYLMYICLLLNAIQNIFHQILTWYQSTLISSRFFFSFQNFFVCEGSPMATSLESVTTIDEPHPFFFPFFFFFFISEKIQSQFLQLSLWSMIITLVRPNQCKELWELRASQGLLMEVSHWPPPRQRIHYLFRLGPNEITWQFPGY